MKDKLSWGEGRDVNCTAVSISSFCLVREMVKTTIEPIC